MVASLIAWEKVFKPKRPKWPDPHISVGRLYRAMGDSSCWEATGCAREAFRVIAEEIKAYLEKYSDPVSSEVTWTMYMIGKTKETADPTVMFCGRDAKCRKQVRKTVKESGILDKHPGVRLGDASLPPDFDQLVQLGDLSYRPAPKGNRGKERLKRSPSISNEQALDLDLYSNQLAFANPSGCISGKKLLIPFHDSSRNLISVRMATGGGILNAAERHFYLTAGHVFQDGEGSFSPDQLKEENDFQFDISDGEDSGDEIVFVDTTSHGNITPDINRSIASDDTSMSSIPLDHSSNETQETQEISRPSGEQRSSSASLDDLLLSSVAVGYRMESLKTSATGRLDYSLVEIFTAFRNTFPLYYSSRPPYSLSGRLLMRQHDKGVISITASAGLIRGTMSGTPTYKNTPSSRSITQLWTVKFESTLSDGDCGSWVVDEESGDLVGHIISGSPKSGFAYILPACYVFEDAAAIFGLELEIMTCPSTDVSSKAKGQSFHSTRNLSIHADIRAEVDMEFFLHMLERLPRERCQSLRLHDVLCNKAVKKNGKQRDATTENLLFPPSIIDRTLVEAEIRSMLTCSCIICGSIKGRELLSDEILVDAMTAKDGHELRKLFGLLVFMGAGFAARQIFSFPPRGWDITNREPSIQSQLFEPLHQALSDIFPSPERATRIFTWVFSQTWQVIDTPKMQIGSLMTNFDGANLPFINEGLLLGDSDSFESVYSFEIHSEFRGIGVPSRAIRKEFPDVDSTLEERRILEFLAKSGKPNFVEVLFWYRFADKINYVFPVYAGSLHQAMEGQLRSQIFPSRPSKYRSVLQHWMWQGIVDVIGALKVLHFPDQAMIQEQLIAAHCDLKLANILVTGKGTLLLSTFGLPWMKDYKPLGSSSLRAQIEDATYQPPHASRPQKVMSTSAGLVVSHTQDFEIWNQASDVWSMACIMTEVIEYITLGLAGFQSFRQRRINEDQSSACFWKRGATEGKYELKVSVQDTLDRFRRTQDRYLMMVTDLIESMFCINPLQRPPIADCLAIVSQDIPTDEWPLKDEDEEPICGLGTNPQLRNITNSSRLRVVVEFEKETLGGENQSKISCILSDSARREEEEFRLVSLFKASYRPNAGAQECSFGIVHPKLSFLFDEPHRGPQEYYHFFTAMTRQRSLQPQVYMPILKCTVKLANLWTKKETYSEGHVQIWKELTEDEFLREFTHNPQEKARQKSAVAETSPMFLGPRSSTEDSIYSQQTRSNEVQTRRLVVFFPGAGQPNSPDSLVRVLTINLTNGYNIAQAGRMCNGRTSNCHVTFKAVRRNFLIGNFPSEKGCAGIPLDPKILAGRETAQVNWVELEFKNPIGKYQLPSPT